MKVKLSECRKQAWSGSEADIHKASFIERRLFYLNYPDVVTRKAFPPTQHPLYSKVFQGM
jgi:hypothetical protein